MGMYTELQGTIVFKSEAIAKAFSMREDHWALISLMTGIESVDKFKDHSRSHWIPGIVRKVDGEIVQFHALHSS